MSTPSITATARLAAKLLAQRPTRQDEVASLIQNVHGALARLDGTKEETSAEAPPRAAGRKRRAKPAVPRVVEEQTSEHPAAPAAPKLVRRAELATAPAAPPATPSSLAAAPNATVRGVVKWFDPRSGKGALRLQGVGDLPIETRHLTESGIARLFKGQEVEATLAGSAQAPQLRHLSLPGMVAGTALGGMVRGRGAKTVLVELKRESLRRAAARAKAEQLLRRPR